MSVREVSLPRLSRGHIAEPRLRAVPDLPVDVVPTVVSPERALDRVDLTEFSDHWVIDTGTPATEFVATTRDMSRFARTLDSIHSAALSPLVVALDALIIFGASIVSGLSPLSGALSTLLVVLAFYLLQVYAERDAIQSKGIAWYLSKMTVPVFVIIAFGLISSFKDAEAVRFSVSVLVGLVGMRFLSWMVLSHMRMSGRAVRRTLIVGTGPAVATVATRLHTFPQVGLAPIGSLAVHDVIAEDGLASVIRVTRAEHVILAPELGEESALVESIRRGGGALATFSLLPPLADLFLHPASTNELGGLPLVPLGRLLRRRSTFPGKRVLDIVVGSVALLFASPVMAIAALAIKLDSRGPVFFRQDRVGRDSENFRVFKFRSMVVGAHEEFDELRKSAANVSDGLLFKHVDDHRVTRVGRILRGTAIDELPQLLNVLMGQMSLVGPRPLAVSAEEFDTVENERHSVSPGMTGYWQVSGGNGLTYQEMVRLDLAYIRNWSLFLDIRLLIKTVPALLNRRRVT